MGLALDEPREGDNQYEVDGLNVVVDAYAMKVITDSGGLTIKNTLFGPTAELAGAVGCG
jgi:hypothetical protein